MNDRSPHAPLVDTPRDVAHRTSTVSRTRLIAAFGAIYFFWGATFLAIRYLVAEVPPLLMMAVRCALASTILHVWLAWRGELARTSWPEWRTALLAGSMLFLFCHGVLAWAEQRVTSGQAALFMTSIPLWMVMLDAYRTRTFPSVRAAAGLILGVIGVAVLGGMSSVLAGETISRLALVFASFSWAAGSLLARNGPHPPSVSQSIAMQLAAGALVLAIASLVAGELNSWDASRVTWRGVSAMAFMIGCGTLLGFGAYTWLLRVASPASVGTYAFVNPIVAIALAWLVGDEHPTARTALAAALVISAVALARDRARAADTDEAAP